MDEKDFERAEKLARAEIDNAIDRSRRSEPPPFDWDGETCSQCGEEVPEARLLLRFHTCVDCQALREKRRRLGLV